MAQVYVGKRLLSFWLVISRSLEVSRDQVNSFLDKVGSIPVKPNFCAQENRALSGKRESSVNGKPLLDKEARYSD